MRLVERGTRKSPIRISFLILMPQSWVCALCRQDGLASSTRRSGIVGTAGSICATRTSFHFAGRFGLLETVLRRARSRRTTLQISKEIMGRYYIHRDDTVLPQHAFKTALQTRHDVELAMFESS